MRLLPHTSWFRAALLAMFLVQLVPNAAQSSPSPGNPIGNTRLVLPVSSTQAASASEVADFIIAPVDESWEASTTLRSRPFILDWNTNPAYQIRLTPQQLDVDQARSELQRFLGLRGLDPISIGQILLRYDDPATIQIVPAPPLRAALLMLTNWQPYDAVVASILEGTNETGMPFAAVEFADLGVANAVATVRTPSAESGGRFLLQISSWFAGEPPMQLLPAIVHESLHGDGENSGPEELIANILDTISYGELLIIDPSAAYAGTELTAYNNLQLYALLNSMGVRGGGHIGIQTSAIGDVFVGPGLEDFDARSIRDSILQDPFYGSLGQSDSPISPTASALIQRFPGKTSLGDQPHFDEELLSLIDRGVSHVITPDLARDLVVALGLSATMASTEVMTPVTAASVLDLESRPFIPLQPAYFELNYSRRPGNVTDELSMQHALNNALIAHAGNESIRVSLERYDSDMVRSLIPDDQLRAAVVLLSAIDPWADIADALLRARPGDVPWQVSFVPMPSAVNATFERTADKTSSVLINEFLIGESLETTAAAIIEGILLESDRPSPNGAVVAALMSTVAYAQFVENVPSITRVATWGTINRNIDLLALLNSTQWSAADGIVPPGALGFLAPSGDTMDVLPGLLIDATSFQHRVFDSARVDGAANVTFSSPSELLIGLAEVSGVSLPLGPAGHVIDQTALLQIDGRVGSLVPADTIATILTSLMLGVAN